MIDTAKRALVGVSTGGADGLGFVVDPAGYIVTSHALIGGSRAVEVTLPDGRRLPVTVVAREPLSGVAVLKVDAAGLSALALGESSALRIGEPVLALGGAQGRPVEATIGTVSATGAATGGDLATDLPAHPARVGGPLLNVRGEAVGITTATPGAQAAAVPIDRVKPLLRGLDRAEPRERRVLAPGADR